MLYLVSYDLVEPPRPRDYGPIESRLQQHHAKRILFCEWIVQTNLTHTQLRDDLVKYVTAHDRLLVIQISAPAAWRNLQISDPEFTALLTPGKT